MSARPALSIACGAEWGAGRTGIASSALDLTLAFRSVSDHERAVELRHLLEKRSFALPRTWAAGFEQRAIQPFVSLE